MTEMTSPPAPLTRFAWLSIAAAVLTIALKSSAYFLTGSVGLLSDALESFVNLAAAIVALFALRLVDRPADDEFTFGYSKIEYFSSGFEGGMILLAAAGIVITAVPRLIHPQPLEQLGVGLAISVAASLVNLGVSLVLLRASKRFNSITLEADARHLMTDVWTTVGVLIGIALVWLTGYYPPGFDHRPAGGGQHPAHRLPAAAAFRARPVGYRPGAGRAGIGQVDPERVQTQRGRPTMPCARGKPPGANSWWCICWCPAAGASHAGTSWPSKSKTRCAPPSPPPTSSPTSSPSTTRFRWKMPPSINQANA